MFSTREMLTRSLFTTFPQHLRERYSFSLATYCTFGI